MYPSPMFDVQTQFQVQRFMDGGSADHVAGDGHSRVRSGSVLIANQETLQHPPSRAWGRKANEFMCLPLHH